MEYKTVRTRGESEYIVKKSRFIGLCECVGTPEEAQNMINSVKTRHRDARHNVSAYILRSGEKRCSDDGEPQGTAGVPILELLESCGLSDICVTVTRYFGGILLGTGGLARAYTHAAGEAVKAAGERLMEQGKIITANFEYPLYGKVSHILPDFTHKLINSDFGETVTLTAAVRSSECERFTDKLTELSAGKARFECTQEKFFDFGEK